MSARTKVFVHDDNGVALILSDHWEIFLVIEVSVPLWCPSFMGVVGTVGEGSRAGVQFSFCYLFGDTLSSKVNQICSLKFVKSHVDTIVCTVTNEMNMSVEDGFVQLSFFVVVGYSTDCSVLLHGTSNFGTRQDSLSSLSRHSKYCERV